MPFSPLSKRSLFFLFPALVWIAWSCLMLSGNHWHLLSENWFMTATMTVGSFIAGATSEGGGAVAFPVMTLLFKIEPQVARDFSLMIQAVGMTMAALLIFCLRICIEWSALRYASLGGVLGIIVGLEVISPVLPAADAKIFFTSLWLSFAIALFWINRQSDRIIHDSISRRTLFKSMLLVMIGFLGGIVSGILGSGIDVLSFTLLTLYFRINEKVATPTSVVLMAINSVVGVLWQLTTPDQLRAEAWNYWFACVPVVVIGAPLGAFFIRDRTREFIVRFLYVVIVVQYLGALLIVPQSLALLTFSGTTVACGILLFGWMVSAGSKHCNYSKQWEAS